MKDNYNKDAPILKGPRYIYVLTCILLKLDKICFYSLISYKKLFLPWNHRNVTNKKTIRSNR